MERKWEELEMDCLVNVFEKLGIEDLTLGVPFVCNSWYKASLNPQCWKSLNFSSELNDVLSERLNNEYRIRNFSFTDLIKFALNRGRRSVVELLLPTFGTLDELIYASNNCPCLKILVLPMVSLNNNDEEIKQLLELFSKWKDLEYVEIKHTTFYTKLILFEIGRHCKNFVGLKMSGVVDNEELLAIVNHLPTLKHLTVTFHFMSREDLKMILEGCKELENLFLRDCSGFKVDEEILKMKMTSNIKNFEYEDLRLDPCHLDSDLDAMLWAAVSD